MSIEPKHGSIFWTTNYSINGISKKKKEKKITIISMVLVFFFLVFDFFFFWCGCLIWYDRKLWAMENLWTESIGYGWKIFFLLLLYIVVLFQNRNRTEISHLSLYFMKSKKWAAFTLLRSIFIRKLNEMSISFLSYYSQTGKLIEYSSKKYLWTNSITFISSSQLPSNKFVTFSHQKKKKINS